MSINKVILLGHTGKDPEVKEVAGSKVANLSLATTEKGYALQNGTQVPDRTEWHNLVFWKGLADVVEKYVRKGTQIYVEGKIKTRQYEDKEKVKRYVTEIFADKVEFFSFGKREEKRETQQVESTPQEPVPGSVDDLPF